MNYDLIFDHHINCWDDSATDEIRRYIDNDIEMCNYVYNKHFKNNTSLAIKNVIFNDPATIVFWEDGTKTVVKCQDGDEFDPEKGLAMAIAKKAYGNNGNYCNKIKKWLPKEGSIDISQKPKNRMTFREEEAKKHPENISALWKGGVLGCPRDKEGNCTFSVTNKNCRACWDREIPDELMDND